ncbi:MAG TPA: UvrD-helicase domain-containing protein, partial [Spirochaetota bacterium]|nr:UvrD-helicase domain-containing protein [Spirochaetota bacterium]
MLEIDIDKHNIIEASAGTGKTHTIQNLVVKILSEKDIDLREILIVTYTEKATGELKDRIRGELENRIKNENDAVFLEKLKSALKNFENCSIHTIHGFCNKIIKEYSFETGLSFNNEIVDDSEIYKKSLKKVMREKWRKKYGDVLTDLLLFSEYPDIDARLRISSFEKNVINIAINFNPQKETLLPNEDLDIVKETLNLKKDIGERLEILRKIVGNINEYEIKKSEFYTKYDNICQNKQKKGRFENIIIPLLEILAEKENQANGYFDFIRALEKWPTFADNGYFNSLIFYGGKTRGKKEESLSENFPELEKIINILENLRIDYGAEKRSKIKSLFLKETIYDLKEQATKDKRENSQLSFSDMLYLLNEGLDNPELLYKLQSRYKYAIVDEFQDTDPVQYEIFTKIFLKSPENRLFIIGDPKQSIYGFRGADVYTYFKAKNDLLKNNAPLE